MTARVLGRAKFKVTGAFNIVILEKNHKAISSRIETHYDAKYSNKKTRRQSSRMKDVLCSATSKKETI